MPDYESDVRKKLKGQVEALNEAYKRLKERFLRPGKQEPIPQIAPLTNALARLKELSDAQYELSGGIQKPLNDESFEALSGAYQQALAACTRYMVNVEENPRGKTALELKAMAGEVTGAVRDISETLVRDMRALDRYPDKEEPTSFQELIAETAPLSLDIGKENLGTVGAALSKRIPFDYTLPEGRHVKGVFTPKKIYDAHGDVEKVISDADENMHGFQEFMDLYLKAYKSVRKLDPDKTSERTLLQFGSYASFVVETDQKGNRTPRAKTGDEFIASVKLLSEQLTQLGDPLGEELKDAYRAIDADSTAEMKQGFEKFTKAHLSVLSALGVNLNAALISDRSRIDSRNSAMSAVADMLGVPQLLARSAPMKIRYQGKELEGTFMEKAKGMDYEHPTPEALQYNKNTFRSRGLKSVADLEVLDLICGNTDRHMANLVYQFDTKGAPGEHKLIGVQGIDNDSSFGKVSAVDGSSSNKYTTLSRLHVISQSMADRVENLNRDEFKMKLRGFELTEEQLEAAAVRLDQLKTKIADGRNYYGNRNTQNRLKKEGKFVDEGQLRTVPDDQFEALDLDQIKEGNFLFTNLSVFDQRMRDKAAQADGKTLGLRRVNQQLGYVIDRKEGESMAKALQDMKAASGIRGTSDAFESLRTAVQKYDRFCRDHRGEALSPEQYKLRTDYLRGIRNAGADYLKHKGLVGTDGKANPSAMERMSGYARKRVQLVLSISQDAVQRLSEDKKVEFYDHLTSPGKDLSPEAKQKTAKDRELLRDSTERAENRLLTKKLGEGEKQAMLP